ncbi:hypothetical protein ACIQVL_33550 [Streptomyces sp. NPDC090499]|uniref:hypothetical protein n=1 Tax=Streptomyces sp. NPDC090499 TaxID=3365965 RepID=UPI00380F60BD
MRKGPGLRSLYRTQQSDGFDEKELALTLELVTHTALSVNNARRLTREHTITAALQRHLLHPAPSLQTAIEIAGVCVADNRGAGGWSNSSALPGARAALVVGGLLRPPVARTDPAHMRPGNPVNT